jgi:hypothetical protein
MFAACIEFVRKNWVRSAKMGIVTVLVVYICDTPKSCMHRSNGNGRKQGERTEETTEQIDEN